MTHDRFIRWVMEQPWALMPESMQSYAYALAHREHGIAIDAAPQSRAKHGSGNGGAGIAVIPVYGTIVERANQLDLCEGGTSTQQISNALAEANADSAVAQIVLDISSPGGSVYGVQELFDEIRSSKKPVVAVANSLAASAAYWIGCAASEFYVTPGGEVGSIGVWTAHQDYSEALKKAGIDVTLISAGDYKVEGNPYAPLGAEAKKFMQGRIDEYYGAFTRGVATGRRVTVADVREGMGKGRVYGAKQALAAQMVDGISTFDQVVATMQKRIKSATPLRTASLAAAQAELAILS
jgi:capsid assembly protease